MGVIKWFSSSSCDTNKTTQQNVINSNPDPSNFKILKYKEIKNNLVIHIEYPDSKNYEGKKILLYRNLLHIELIRQKIIDPHFSENNNFYSPFSRFEPTISGWNTACFLAKNI